MIERQSAAIGKAVLKFISYLPSMKLKKGKTLYAPFGRQPEQ
jgi:hypothetical protein